SAQIRLPILKRSRSVRPKNRALPALLISLQSFAIRPQGAMNWPARPRPTVKDTVGPTIRSIDRERQAQGNSLLLQFQLRPKPRREPSVAPLHRTQFRSPWAFAKKY